MDREKIENVWPIRNVDAETRKKVRMYAAEHDITIATALKELIDLACEVLETPLSNDTVDAAEKIVEGEE